MNERWFLTNRRRFIQAAGTLTGLSFAHITHTSTATEKQVYYVSPSGNDAHPGTFEQPWKTIQKAANTLKAGETVYLREGTYNITEQIRPKYSGIENQWITYAGYPGEKAMIDADLVYVEPATGEPPFARDQGAFQIEKIRYIIVKNITLINSHNAGFTVRDSDYIHFYNNTVINTFASGIAIWKKSSNLKVLGNTIINANDRKMQLQYDGIAEVNPPHEAISMGSIQQFEVAYNHVAYCRKEGIDCKETCSQGKVHHNYIHHLRRQGLYVDAWGGVLEDIEFSDNIVHDCECGIAIGAEDGSEVNTIKIHHNIVFNNRATGLIIARWGEDNLRKNIEIYQNTIHHNGYGHGNSDQPYWLVGGLYFYSTNVKDVKVFNNILSDNSYFQIGYSGDYLPQGLEAKNIQIQSNLIFDQNQVTYPVYLEEWAKDYVYQTKGIEFVETQPAFKDAFIGNFYLDPEQLLEQPEYPWGAFSPEQTESFWWMINFPPIIQPALNAE
jgi:hypothetical protein